MSILALRKLSLDNKATSTIRFFVLNWGFNLVFLFLLSFLDYLVVHFLTEWMLFCAGGGGTHFHFQYWMTKLS